MKKSLCLSLIISCLLCACSLPAQNSSNSVTTGTDVTESASEISVSSDSCAAEIVPEASFLEYDITLLAVGDNLLHPNIINTGKQEDGTYNYSFLFEGISDFLDIADIKMINQETIFGGNELEFSGYPYFNSPTQVGDAIAEAGFNVVLQASNHTADQKISGIENCSAFWATHPEVLVTGIPVNGEPASRIPLLTIKNITFAVLNYTYGPNMEVLPKDLENHMNFLCEWNEKTRCLDFTTLNPQVLSDIEKAKELADIVIVCPHWGTEYTTTPSSYQKKWALQMTKAGADLIIGTHPHVIQPIEWIEAENGNKALCYYSLGNYASGQDRALCMLEAMAWVTFHVTENDIYIQEKNTGAVPLVCHYIRQKLRFENIYLLENYTSELASAHGIRHYEGVVLRYEDLLKWSDDVLGDRVLSSSDILPAHKLPFYMPVLPLNQ